ncbi:MAG: ribosome recycling factor [Candidatus Saganbacteria bacterium]|uniref:Ribosome-recycling factor n=1 Tax=Candidatus Saganbacteria bacterium TaxID=2575572 RepID=A0A833L3F5_UNCSA|nr:MAG: ribosome recycling factor [Candidatus Saganbacteria bacterium]
MADIIKDSEIKMKKAVDVLKQKFLALRTGRATPAIVEHLKVEYYGAQTPLLQLAGISVPEAHTITINAYDKGAIKDIEKAIMKSDLGVTPKVDGGVIRLSFPPLTEERRRELVKVIKKEAEEAKVVIRNLRREAMDLLKASKEKKEISEDIEKMKEEEAQKLTDQEIKEIDRIAGLKEKEIMEV